MKKSLKTLLGLSFTAALFGVLTVMAAAADNVGVYDLRVEPAYRESCTLKAENLNQKAPLEDFVSLDNGLDRGVYTDAVRFSLQMNSLAANTQVMVVVQDIEGAPTDGHIRYINQLETGAGGEVTFDLYPDQLASGEYTVQIAPIGGALQKVAAFSCGIPTGDPGYILGNVNESPDGKVDAQDVTRLMKHVARLEYLEGKLLLAGNVNYSPDGKVDAQDVTRMMQHVARLNYLVGVKH